jgi:hypothetical protein
MFLDNGTFAQYGENTIITMQRARTLGQGRTGISTISCPGIPVCLEVITFFVSSLNWDMKPISLVSKRLRAIYCAKHGRGHELYLCGPFSHCLLNS